MTLPIAAKSSAMRIDGCWLSDADRQLLCLPSTFPATAIVAETASVSRHLADSSQPNTLF